MHIHPIAFTQKKLLIPAEEIGGLALAQIKLVISHHDLMTRHFGNDVAKVFFQRATEFFFYNQESFRTCECRHNDDRKLTYPLLERGNLCKLK